VGCAQDRKSSEMCKWPSAERLRKNYLFIGHAEAGQNLAVLQTICHTCLFHDVNSYEYIKDVLVRVSSLPASKRDERLPQNGQSPP
jgi:hypothetical protein